MKAGFDVLMPDQESGGVPLQVEASRRTRGGGQIGGAGVEGPAWQAESLFCSPCPALRTAWGEANRTDPPLRVLIERDTSFPSEHL